MDAQVIYSILYSVLSVEFILYTDKKEIQIFLIFKEIQNGAVAKSYMTNGLLIYGDFLIY